MYQSKLRDRTIELLKSRPRTLTLAKISEDTKIPVTWLECFRTKGKDLESSVNKVETLYEYLAKTTLQVEETKKDVEFQFKAFEEALSRYFNLRDEEKAKDAFVFYMSTHGFQRPTKEDLDWAQMVTAVTK